ncbi:type VI immunity family protein [Gemmatimonas sp.]|uniref:type VI immunity family protein n=1 Tax=Gemmatimonas sp. TaxID=1962908 RepID=UPI0037BF539C
MRALFKLLDAPCGYLHVSTDHGLALSELGFERIMGRRPPEDTQPDGARAQDVGGSVIRYNHPEDTNDRVEQLAEIRSLVGPRLRGTYWGTFLGREMVDELGGAERITREAPVHLVESFGDGALYLQLTPVPEPITTPAMQTGLIALEQFLQPVLVPLPPYWATRAGNA